MKKPKSSILLRALGFMERYPDYKELVHELEKELRPPGFVDSIKEVAQLKMNEPKMFKQLIEDYVLRAKNQQVKRLNKIFKSIQQLLNGASFEYGGSSINSSTLARKLLTEPKGGKKIQHQFSILEYSVVFGFGQGEGGYGGYFHSISLFQEKNQEKILLAEFSSSSISTSYYELLPLGYQKSKLIFDVFIDVMGEGLSMSPWLETRDKKLSLYGYVATAKAEASSKEVPKPFMTDYNALYQWSDEGNMSKLKAILKREYALQKREILPELMARLHLQGKHYIDRCRHSRRVMDTTVPLRKKIHGVLDGRYVILEVPSDPGSEPRPTAVFALMCQEQSQAEVFQKALFSAGWHGSLILATINFPSMYDLIKTRQIDFLVQTKLGHNGWKDLYENEIKNQPFGNLWKNKVIKCSLPEFFSEGWIRGDFSEAAIASMRGENLDPTKVELV